MGPELASEANGTIRVTEDVESGLLVMRDPLLSDVGPPGTVAAEDREQGSQWGGLSGALVFHQGIALGIVIEHHPRQGSAAITILPAERFAADSADGDAGSQAAAEALGLPRAHELRFIRVRPSAEADRAAGSLSGIFRSPLAAPPAWAPGFLLRPEYEVVPLEGMEQVIASLIAWCTDVSAGPLRLLTSPGGYGKSRLAGELVKLVSARGWIAGLVRSNLEPGRLAALADQPSSGVLLVFDYAETRARQVSETIEWITGNEHLSPKVLLLSRSEGSWLDQLRSQSIDVELAMAASKLEGDSAGVIRLPEPFSGTQRSRLFATAARAFAERLNAPDSLSLPLMTSMELSADLFQCVLRLHMSALAYVLSGLDGHVDTSAALRDPIARLFSHEERYWKGVARQLGVGVPPATLRRAVAITSVFGARNRAEILNLISCTPDLSASRAQAAETAAFIEDIYPSNSEDSRYGNLQPDLLAEELAVMEFTESPSVLSDVLAHVAEWQIKNALTVIDRASQRLPDAQPLLAVCVDSALDSSPRAVVEVISESRLPTGLVRVLARKLRESGESPTEREVVRHIPQYSVALSGLGIELLESAISAQRKTLTADDFDSELNLAKLLAQYGTLLHQRGRWADALQARAEARERYEKLSHERPDQTYQTELGAYLDHEASSYARLGRMDEALDRNGHAMEIIRGIFAQQLGDKSRPFLKTIIERLVSTGRPIDRAAVERYSRPAVNLGTSLNIRAQLLNNAERYVEAASTAHEAVEVFQWMSNSIPGGLGFHVDSRLAGALNQLATASAEADSLDKALSFSARAVEILHGYAVRTPDEALRPFCGILEAQLNLLLRKNDNARAAAVAKDLLHCINLIESASPEDFPDNFAAMRQRLRELLTDKS